MAAALSTLLSLPSRDQSSLSRSPDLKCCMQDPANVFCRATPVDGGFTVKVPEAPEGTAPIAGQSYVVLTGCNTTVSDDTVAAGPAIVEVWH